MRLPKALLLIGYLVFYLITVVIILVAEHRLFSFREFWEVSKLIYEEW